MPGESRRFLVAAGQTEGWVTLRATYGGFASDFRVFVSSIVVKRDPPVVLLSVPEFEVGPTTATFTIEAPPESEAIFTGAAASDGETARFLVFSYASLARYLAETAGDDVDTERVIEALQKGLQLEEEAEITGGEEKAASFTWGYLINRWTHTDGEAFMRVLRSPNVPLKAKMGIIEWLQETVQKEYPGEKQE